jgi:zinc protease
MGSFPLRLDSTAKMAQVLGPSGVLSGLGFDYFAQYTKWIERVTKEDVQRVANSISILSTMRLVVVGNISKAKIRH